MLKYIKPSNWKKIKPEHYRDFSVMDNEDTPCEVSFAVPTKTKGIDVVSIFNYGEVGNSFLKELTNQLDLLKEDSMQVDDVNKYIKEKADGYAVTKTDYIQPLYYKKGNLVDKKVFINIMKIKTNISINYSLQIFVSIKENMYCLTTSLHYINEHDILNSVLNNSQTTKDMINVLLKSLE